LNPIRQFSILLILCSNLGVVFSEDRVIGFRGDGNGDFPNANPPTQFSEQENLRWKVAVGQGCGSVIIVGDRLFVQAAPNALICLEKQSGKELWRRTHHVGQLDPNILASQYDAAMDDLGVYHAKCQTLLKLSKDDPKRGSLEFELKTLESRLPKDILGQVAGAQIGGYGYGGRFLICMTPCSDGNSVVAVFPTGIAVAYDLQGTLLWSISIRPPVKPPVDWPKGAKYVPIPTAALSTCPVFSSEGIVVVIYGYFTYGIDAKNGKILWQHLSFGDSCASPIVRVIGKDSFVATGNGNILRVRDGMVLHQGEGPFGTSSVSPVYADGVFHWVPLAIKVIPGEVPKAEVLWSISGEALEKVSAWKYYKGPYLSPNIDFTSPVIINKQLLYFPWKSGMTIFDTDTGKVIAQHQIGKGKAKVLSGGMTKNWAYSGMVRAGNYLILAHDNGVVKFIPINETFSPVQSCAVPDDLIAQPSCDGPALYLRSMNNLYRFDNPNPNPTPKKRINHEVHPSKTE